MTAIGIIVFYAVLFAIFMYLVWGVSSYAVLGGTIIGAFGWRDEVFVNNAGTLVYHRTRNFLPTNPKLVSMFSELHESPLTRDEAFARLSDTDKSRYRQTGIESILESILDF